MRSSMNIWVFMIFHMGDLQLKIGTMQWWRAVSVVNDDKLLEWPKFYTGDRRDSRYALWALNVRENYAQIGCKHYGYTRVMQGKINSTVLQLNWIISNDERSGQGDKGVDAGAGKNHFDCAIDQHCSFVNYNHHIFYICAICWKSIFTCLINAKAFPRY